MGKIPDVFRPGTLAALRPEAIQQHVVLVQQQQHIPSPAQQQQPQLLQRLYDCLDQAAIQEALAHHHGSELPATAAKQRALRELNAYHQVFELLMASLTTYRPLLLRIKHTYDDALQDAAAAACDNAYLHSKLSIMPHKHVRALGTLLPASTSRGQLDRLLAHAIDSFDQIFHA